MTFLRGLYSLSNPAFHLPAMPSKSPIKKPSKLKKSLPSKTPQSNSSRPKTLNQLFRKYEVFFAYQFGSTVNATANAKSDIDIAIYLSPKLTAAARFDIQLDLIPKLSSFFKKEVDLVVLNDIRSLFFKYIIYKEGKLIFESRHVTRVEYECRLMSLYFDYAPFLEQYNRAYVQSHI